MTSVCLTDPSEEEETLLRLHRAELREWLTKAILLLPEQERLFFTLHYYGRLTMSVNEETHGTSFVNFSVYGGGAKGYLLLVCASG
jgi:hypothetical protein